MRLKSLFTTASVAALGFVGAASADNNTLFVEQIQSNNFVDASQSGFGNETYASQDGNFNTGNASVTGNNNRALLIQQGNRNSGGWSSQGAATGNNNAIGVVQTTNQNFAGLSFQQGGADNSQIFVRQRGGNGNYVGNGAPIDAGTNPGNSTVGNGAQNGSTRPLSNDGVDGSLLVGSVPTTGDQNAKTFGNFNRIGIDQNGAGNALALNVDGDFNRVGGSANSALFDLALGDFASGFYSGGDDIAPGENQFGVGGLATQDGNNNTGLIDIVGSSNAVGFAQIGNNNVNEVRVNGSNNVAVAYQN